MDFLKNFWLLIKTMSAKDVFWLIIVLVSRIPLASLVFTFNRSYQTILILWLWALVGIYALIYYADKLVALLAQSKNKRIRKLVKRNGEFKNHRSLDYLSAHAHKTFFVLRVLAVEFVFAAIGISPLSCFIDSIYKTKTGAFVIWAGILVKIIWLSKLMGAVIFLGSMVL